MAFFRKGLCLLLFAVILLCASGCMEPQNLDAIDWNLHGTWVNSDGTVQSGQEGVEFSLQGNLPTDFEPYSYVEDMELNFIWPEDFPCSNEGLQTYVGGANPAEKHENQILYHGGKYTYSDQLRQAVFLSYTICPEEGFVVLHIEDRYLVASVDPNANPAEIFDFYQEYVSVSP